VERIALNEETDYRIFTALEKHRALTPKAISESCHIDLQKVYSRVTTMVRNGSLAGVTYFEKKGKHFVKRSTLYYPYNTGNAELAFSSLPPSYKELPSLYTSSLVIQNIALPFEDGRTFKKESHLPNNYIVDLVYDNVVVLIERDPSPKGRLQLLQQCSRLMRIASTQAIIVLSKTPAKISALRTCWKKYDGPQVQFFIQDDYVGISRYLETIKATN